MSETGERRTGVARVDQVVQSIEDLSGLTLEEHPAVFEKADAELRRALETADVPEPLRSVTER